MARVFVGMSGGVDSSVAAALLLSQGHDVTGVTMALLPGHDQDPGAHESAASHAASVCRALGVPHLVWDLREVFEHEVIIPFAEEYASGRTPNPCARCNARVKFGALLSRSLEHGAEMLATGHYARIEADPDGTPWLARAADRSKDQSYFLYGLGHEQLARVSFPLGEMSKAQVRECARQLGLPTAERAESQEICFVPDNDHAGLVAALCPQAVEPGEIVDRGGVVLGRHRGLAHYTVGQRKGLGIAAEQPLYVLELDAERNRVIVGPSDGLIVHRVEARVDVWRLSSAPVPVEVMTRYRMKGVPAIASVAGEVLLLDLDAPVGAVAPGQSVVCYVDDRVVGGGTITCAR